MRVIHDILEVVVAVGVMVMFLAVLSYVDIGTAKQGNKPPPATQEVIYVSAAAPGPGSAANGSEKHPFKTIQDGLNQAVSGQTVLAGPGIYYGQVELKNGVKLISRGGPEVTIIDGQGAAMAVLSPYSEAPKSWLQGFTLRNADVLVDIRNRISIWSASSMDISDCVFHDALRGITITANGTADIKTSVFTGLDEALASLWNTHTVLKNVTVDQVGYVFALHDSKFDVYNTSISRSGCVAWQRGGSGIYYVTGSNNNICSCTAMTEPSKEGVYPQILFDNLSEEHPMFVNPDAMDYHLQAGSPLIDKGVDVGLPYYGAAPDIGAYEFVPPGVSAITEYGDRSYAVNVALPEAYEPSLPQFRSEGERLRATLNGTVMEVIDELNAIGQSMPAHQQINALMALRDRLVQDVFSKADGNYGGNPADDWITSQAEQANVIEGVNILLERIDARINALTAPVQ